MAYVNHGLRFSHDDDSDEERNAVAYLR